MHVSRATATSSVSWRDEPTVARAKVHRKMIRPCWVPCEPDDQHPTGRRTFDPDHWDDRWSDDPEKEDQRPRLYPIWSTTADELAVIGGPGVRLYFALLKLVTTVFFLLAVIMSFAIALNFSGDMYSLPAASDFVTDERQTRIVPEAEATEAGFRLPSPLGQTFWARTTLGALTRCNSALQKANSFVDCDVRQESPTLTDQKLLGYAAADMLAVVVLLFIVRAVNKRKTELDALSDAAMVSMSDYTVQLRPQGHNWKLPNKADAPLGQLRTFKEGLRNHVERHLGPVASVEINGNQEIGIWLAFAEEHRIELWREKVQLLYRLEEALGRLDGRYTLGFARGKAKELKVPKEDLILPVADGLGGHERPDAPKKTGKLATQVAWIVLEMESINNELSELGQSEDKEVVTAFVAFEDEKHQDKACDLVLSKAHGNAVHPDPNDLLHGPLYFHGRQMRVREAPEPDTINFQHLQYTADRRNMRRALAGLGLLCWLVAFNIVILAARKLSTDLAFETVCGTIAWDNASDYALCDGAYAGNFTSEAQDHYKARWQHVDSVLGTDIPKAATVTLAHRVLNNYTNETAECELSTDSDCCDTEHRTWQAAAEQGCTRVWTVDANLSFFPTTRGDGNIGLLTCDVDRDCVTPVLSPEPGRPAGSRPTCESMDCPVVTVGGADWVTNPLAKDWECFGGLNQGCDPTNKRDVQRCCTKTLTAEMSKGHSVEAVCYHCICDCLGRTAYGQETHDDFPKGCPSPADGWTTELQETYCAGDNGWDQWDATVNRWSLFNSILTTTINQILKAGLEGVVELEKAHTRAQEQSSLALKVALAQFANTVLLSMVSTMYIQGFLFTTTVYPSDGLTPWANARWYYQVGTSFMMTMTINQCLPLAIHAGKYWAFRSLHKLKFDKGSLSFGARTQNRLNQIYGFNDWKLASSYGEVLFVTTSTLLLCTALPMLLWIATFGMGLKYWGDKTAVLRCYVKPPLYSSALFDGLDTKLYLILAMHLVSATYFLSVAGGYTPDQAYNPGVPRLEPSNQAYLLDPESFQQPHVLPLWIAAVLVFALPVGRHLYVQYKGKDYWLSQQRKKKIDALQAQIKEVEKMSFEALRNRYSFTEAEMQRLEELMADESTPFGKDGLHDAVDTVMQERDDSSKLKIGEKLAGLGGKVSDLADEIAHSPLGLVSGVMHKADDAMHDLSPTLGKITDVVGGAGKSIVKTSGKALAVGVHAGAVVAGGAGAVVKGGVRVGAGAVGAAASGAKTATALVKMGPEEFNGLGDDELFDAVAGSISKGFSLAAGDFLTDREIDNPDAALPKFSEAQEQELLVNTHDHYDLDDASNLLLLQRSFRDTFDECHERLQPKLASVHKRDAGGLNLSMQRLSMAVGVCDFVTGEKLTDVELQQALRPEMFEMDPRAAKGGRLPPIEKKPVIFMAP